MQSRRKGRRQKDVLKPPIRKSSGQVRRAVHSALAHVVQHQEPSRLDKFVDELRQAERSDLKAAMHSLTEWLEKNNWRCP